MIYALIIIIVLLIVSFLWNISNDKDRTMSALCLVIFSYVVSGIMTFLELDKQPKAIEVYQGKTTLEITYKDSIPVDSVVVYKED